MARAQTGLEQLLAQSRQQSESTIFEEQFILHPYCESRMYLLCTFKIITKSPCFNGSAALRRPRPRRADGIHPPGPFIAPLNAARSSQRYDPTARIQTVPLPLPG